MVRIAVVPTWACCDFADITAASTTASTTATATVRTVCGIGSNITEVRFVTLAVIGVLTRVGTASASASASASATAGANFADRFTVEGIGFRALIRTAATLAIGAGCCALASAIRTEVLTSANL